VRRTAEIPKHVPRIVFDAVLLKQRQKLFLEALSALLFLYRDGSARSLNRPLKKGEL
jgi:hypothetical protein